MPESASGQALRFDFEWRTTLFTALLFPLLLGLGVWQLDRAEEKRGLDALYESRRDASPVPLATLWQAGAADVAYRRVSVRGRLDPARYLLLDNRVREGRFGYEVLAVLHLDDGDRAVLVNLGWVAGDPARRALPRIDLAAGEVSVRASVYVPPGEPYVIGEPSVDGAWPLVIQALDMTSLREPLQQRLGSNLFPWSLRLDAGDPLALEAGWPLVNASPERHTGYAVQWFSMAAVLALIFVLRSSNLWQIMRRSKDGER